MGTLTASEVQARREALGLSQTDLAKYLRVSQVTISRWEGGKTRPPSGIDVELTALEQRIEGLVGRMVEFVLADNSDLGFLMTHTEDETFWGIHPEHEGLPATIHRVATARARAELADEGIVLRIMAATDLPA